MAKAKDEQESRYARALNSDPEIARLLAQFRAEFKASLPAGTTNIPPAQLAQYLDKSPTYKALQARMAALGIDTNEWKPTVSQDGTWSVDHQNWAERHPVATTGLIAGGVLGAPIIIGGIGAGTAATGGSAAATGGYSAPPAVAGGSWAGSGGGVVAGAPGAGVSLAGTAGPSTGSWVTRLFNNPIAQAGAEAGLNYLDRRSQRKANNEAIEKALEEQRKATKEAQDRLDRQERLRGDLWNQSRTDYQGTAGIPFQTLGGYLGMKIPTVGPVKLPNQLPTDPSAVPSGPAPVTSGGFAPGSVSGGPGSGLGQPGAPPAPATKGASLGDMSGVGMVQLQAPTGETEWVPEAEADHYESLGARRVS